MLARYRELEHFAVWGTYAALVQAASLKALDRLESLALYDFYDLATDSLPPSVELPRLDRATFVGLRRSDAGWLKKHWGTVADLDVRGAKNDAWVAANAGNPLRDWVDDGEAFGDRACKAYAKAHRVLSKGLAAPEVERTLRDFVSALNKLDAKFQLIDTVRREQALAACEALCELGQVDPATAAAWFDAERDF